MARARLFRSLPLALLLAAALHAAAAGDDDADKDVVVREVGNLVLEDIPEIPAAVVDRMRRYRSARSASLQGWGPGGRGILIGTRFDETTQLHLVGRPLGARTQVTFHAEPISSARVRPGPDRRELLLARDVGGGEFYQLFLRDLDSGRETLLTDGKSRYGAFLWSHAGDRFAYYGTERNGRDWDIYVGSPERPGEAKRVLEAEGTWVPVDWSPDDARLLVMRYVSANESYLHVLDVASGKLDLVAPAKPAAGAAAAKVAIGAARFAPDGEGVYLTSDADGEFRRLAWQPIGSGGGGAARPITADIPWDVEDVEVADKGGLVAFTINEDGMDVLYILEHGEDGIRKVPGLPPGQIAGLAFHPAGRHLAFGLNTHVSPGDIHVLDAEALGERPAGAISRWTRSEVGGLDTSRFVAPTLVRYPSFDTVDGAPRQIPAFSYRPKGAGPHPVLISIHGGPEGQFTPRFSSTIQYWVNELGIAVLAPNVRGSAGYGKSYLLLDNGPRREDSVKDIGALLDWIDAQPDLDAKRVAVTGGSYGGYMVLASMTHFNDRLAAGIDVVGISNFVTFLENTKPYRRDLRRVEYGDERDPEMRTFLESISPTTNAGKISKPMFIAQGLNDPRVPAGESRQIVDVIRSNGGRAWYFLAKDEGHGFRKKSNADHYVHAAALFLERHLVGASD